MLSIIYLRLGVMTRETREGGAPTTTWDSHGGEKGNSHKCKRGKCSFGKKGKNVKLVHVVGLNYKSLPVV
jgi:hypothetical protein